jgi:hypothetical protein
VGTSPLLSSSSGSPPSGYTTSLLFAPENLDLVGKISPGLELGEEPESLFEVTESI